MSQIPYSPPSYKSRAFNCPLCHAFANQIWADAYGLYNGYSAINGVAFSHCTHCNSPSIWHSGALIYPDTSQAPLPNPDLPDDIRFDYEEARQIINRSPRGAAALLRLCIQKLCAHLGESGKNINADIASLVKKGLNPKIQKSLDIVRVIGNEAVHPGTIDLTDNPQVAVTLCQLINIITEAMITQPKLISALYEALPDDKISQIQKRDGEA